MNALSENTKHILDGAAFVSIVGALVGWLPAIAAGMSVIWLGMQMYTWIVNKKWQPETKKNG